MLLQRTRVRPLVQAVATSTKKSVALPRRLQPTLKPSTTAENVRDTLDATMKSIANLEAEVDAAKLRLDAEVANMEAIMRKHKVSRHVLGDRTAAIEEQFTNQQRIIDPKTFMANVPRDVFFRCAEISVMKAGQHLGTAEMARVVTTKPGVSKGYVFSLKQKKKRGASSEE